MKKSQKRKIILYILILIIVFLLILIIAMSNRNKKPIAQANPINNETDEDTKNDGILNLSGFGVFFDNYTGELMSSEIATGLKEITINKIPRIYKMIKDYNDSDLKIFYNNNKNSIQKMIGIDNEDDFVHFANGLKNSNVKNFGSWDRLDILTDTFKNDSDKNGYSYAEYEVTYKDNSIIRFSAYISKTSSNDVLYIINTVN